MKLERRDPRTGVEELLSSMFSECFQIQDNLFLAVSCLLSTNHAENTTKLQITSQENQNNKLEKRKA